MKRTISAFLIICLIIVLIISQTACGLNPQNQTNQGYSKTTFALDTTCTVTVYGINSDMINDGESWTIAAQNAVEEAFAELRVFENLLSKSVNTSEVAILNGAGTEAVEVSGHTLNIITKALEVSRMTDGAFDITLGKVTKLWNFRDNGENHQGGEIPASETILEALQGVNYEWVDCYIWNWNEENKQVGGNAGQTAVSEGDLFSAAGTVTLTHEGMEIDLGGIAKGYIADKLAETLEARGVVSAIVNLGGNIVTLGGKAIEQAIFPEDVDDVDRYSDFSLGVNNPNSSSSLLSVYYGRNLTMVTSGTYERYFEVDGVKYHHILDSKTGYPVDTDVLQVTLVAPRGMSMDCDALSTACLAMGKDAALSLIEGIDGIEALVLTTDGKTFKTSGFLGE